MAAARYVALILPTGQPGPPGPTRFVSPQGRGDCGDCRSSAAAAANVAGHFVDRFIDGCDPALLGSKGAGLVRMCQLGLPVPPGFVLTSELWRQIARSSPPLPEPALAEGRFAGRDATAQEKVGLAPEPAWPEGLWSEVAAALPLVEAAYGARLGDSENPLLLAVRSGAAVSMPGMMTSVCNLGLNDAAVAGLARRLGDRRCALDCYRRFLHCYGTVVLGLQPAGAFDSDPLDALLFEYKQRRGILNEADFGEEDLAALCAAYKDEIRRRLGEAAVPDDPVQQLRAAVAAVLRSWDSPRARDYRRLHNIPHELGTAVTIQAMVFGNLSARVGSGSGDLGGAGGTQGPSPPRFSSAAGVAFTRDPSSGEPVLYGEFLPAAQGEDVVAGGHTPRPIGELAALMPAAHRALCAAARTLEQHLGDMQDIEFTIERDRLWLLQTRTGKRSGRAMLKIACDLQREGQLSIEQALLRVEAARLVELLHPAVDRQAPRILLARGLPASPGAATGRLVMSSAAAAELRRRGEAAILTRVETSSDDIVGIQAAAGVLTARGGMTSHAAVVARGMGRSAVVGATALQIDYARQELRTREHVVRRGEIITIDGNSGEVLLGAVPLRTTHLLNNPDYGQLMTWADAHARVRVLAEADSEVQAQLCRDLGLCGIGLTRSERLLCHPERAAALRELCERPGQEAAVGRLADVLTPRYRALLAAAPAGAVMLRLLDPEATLTLLRAGDCELPERERELLGRVLTQYGRAEAEGGVALRQLWEAQLRAMNRAAQGLPAAARPLALIPSSVALAETAALAALLRALQVAQPGSALGLGALVSGPAARARCAELAPHVDVLGFVFGELPAEPSSPMVNPVASPPASKPPARSPVPRGPGKAPERTCELDQAERSAELGAAVALARAGKHDRRLQLGLYAFDYLHFGAEEQAVEKAERLGLDFVVCPPLRAPIARLIAAQVRLRDATDKHP